MDHQSDNSQSLNSTAVSRRAVIKGAAAITAAVAGSSALAQGHSAGRNHNDIVDATLACVKDAEACMHHLVSEMAGGASELGDCAHKVSESIAVCKSMVTLAAHDSPHLPGLARVAITVKEDCAAECEKHAASHEACAALARSCRDCIAAFEQVVA